ncbi:hypothetical protein M441DRAFT_62701, partial [Trichoderma asperellum CBS 433.97]
MQRFLISIKTKCHNPARLVLLQEGAQKIDPRAQLTISFRQTRQQRVSFRFFVSFHGGTFVYFYPAVRTWHLGEYHKRGKRKEKKRREAISGN